MSVNIDENNVTVTVSQDIQVDNEQVVSSIVNEYPNTVTVKSNEYAIVGDGLFATTKEEVPAWMRALVNDLARSVTVDAYNAMSGFNYNLYNAMLALQVAENKYQQVINTRITDQEAFVQAVETLNSTVQNSEAEIVSIKQTYATRDFAVATAADTLEASINGGAIKSSLGSLASSMTNQYGTMAQRVDVLESTFENLELGVEGYANATNTLETYVGVTEGVPDGSGLLGRVDILEKQNDGRIDVITGTYDVMIGVENPNNDTNNDELDITKEPYATWLAEDILNGGIETRSVHVGDVYIKYSSTNTGYKTYERAYKFIKTAVDTSSPYATDSEGFTWALIVDTDAQNAYVAALNAYDLADNKRRVFVDTPVPPYDVGDLWSVQAGATIIGSTQGGRVIQAGDLLRCAETKLVVGAYEHNDWIPADSYREGINALQAELTDFVDNTYDEFVLDIQGQVDKKAETFYQGTLPIDRLTKINVTTDIALDKFIGDLWKNTSTSPIDTVFGGVTTTYLGNNTEYIYTKVANGSNWDYKWVHMEVPDIVFDTIDTKKSIYTGNTAPVDSGVDIVQVNDTWITGDAPVSPYKAKTLYIYNGSSWVEPLRYTDDSAVTTLSNGLAGGTVTVKLTNAYIGDVLLTTHLTNELDNLVAVYSGTDHNDLVGMKDGDIYIESTTEASSSGVPVSVVNTYKYDGTSWVQINNNDNLTALADLADGKRSIFSGSTVPVGAVDRDIWIPSADSGSYKQGEVYQYLGGVWSLATRYTEDLTDFVTEIYTPKVTSLQEQVDGKVESWYTESGDDPKEAWTTQEIRNLHKGDLWYQTDTKNSYYYDATIHDWRALENQVAKTALEALAETNSVSDKVVISYYAIEQAAAPATSKLWLDNSGTKVLKKYDTSWVDVSAKEGDTLTAFNPVDNDTRVYVYRGSTWATETPSGIVASSKAVTDLRVDLYGSNGGNINSTTSLKNTLEGAISTEGSRVESKFAYNSSLVLNNVPYSSGFGLATSINDSTIPTGSSEFWINADKLKMTSGAHKAAPFSIDATGEVPQVVFNGKVTFAGGTLTGTIDQAIQSSIDLVTVGDKNINITDNLIPPDVMVTDTENAGYHFVGNPVKTMEAGIDTFSEVQVTLDSNDEVYSPFVDEVVFPYYYRFGIKGISSLSGVFYITLIDDLDQITYQPVTVNLEPGKTISSSSWYIVDGIINPAGSGAGASGRILTPGLEKVATIDNFTLPAGTAKILLGWVGSCIISRMKLAKITADTFTGTVATVDYVEGQGYVAGSDIYAAGTTEIDGGRIKTGSITAEQIAAHTITANNIQSVNIDGYTINAAKLTGALIEGSVIKASWIDLTSNGTLTNWQYFTPATVPTEYRQNFAKVNITGDLVVDSLGYVRLPGYSTLSTSLVTSNTGISPIQRIVSYDYYQEDIRRPVSSIISLSVEETILSDMFTTGGGSRTVTTVLEFLDHVVTVATIGASSPTITIDGVSTVSSNYTFLLSGVSFNVVKYYSGSGGLLNPYTTLFKILNNTNIDLNFSGKSGLIKRLELQNSSTLGSNSLTFPAMDIAST